MFKIEVLMYNFQNICIRSDSLGIQKNVYLSESAFVKSL
jgi:hypothetical protein